MFTWNIFSASKKIVNLPFNFVIAALMVSTLVSASPLNHQTTSASPISISLPLPLASVPQPVTITKNTNTNNNNNDVIGYIVLPYPGIDQRADMTQAAAPTAPLFSLLGPGPGAVPPATAFGGLGRTYRRFRPNVYNPLYYNPYGVFPGYGIYGYNPRIPLFNFLG